eukprot:Gb_04119 [translate_table: standard]
MELFSAKVVCTIASIFITGLLLEIANVFWLRLAKLRRMMHRQGVGGPPPRFIVGNLADMKKMKQLTETMDLEKDGCMNISHDFVPRIFPYYHHWTKTYGKRFVYWMGSTPILYIQDADLIKEISLSRSLNLGKPSIIKEARASLFGIKGLLLADGKHWAHQRKVAAPALYMDKIKGMVNAMAESSVWMLNKWEENVRREGGSAEIRVDQDLSNVTADIIARTCFGCNYHKGKQVFEKLRSLQLIMAKRDRNAGIPGSRFLPTAVNRECWKLGKEIGKLLEQIIEDRRQNSELDCGSDLLGTMISAGEGRVTDVQDLVDQCKSFFFAGHETSALCLTWTMMLLALSPEWQDRARAEVMEMSKGSIPDADILAKMKTVGMVLNESLRLYPPAPIAVREMKQDMKFGGLWMPRGTCLWFGIVGLHHDPDIWGPDVHEFRPERFITASKQSYSSAFIPFGVGTRICLGQNFAVAEIKLLLSMILSRFRISLSPTYRHSPTLDLTLRPAHGMYLVLHSV